MSNFMKSGDEQRFTAIFFKLNDEVRKLNLFPSVIGYIQYNISDRELKIFKINVHLNEQFVDKESYGLYALKSFYMDFTRVGGFH